MDGVIPDSKEVLDWLELRLSWFGLFFVLFLGLTLLPKTYSIPGNYFLEDLSSLLTSLFFFISSNKKRD